ncbi:MULTISPECIES: acyl-CoA dehydrogenase family protein [Weeksella]|uniref:Butyryl-CoA dehydrogenase n=1 Tax=Weeksella virosa (strain ATCC 43766 / DSM 16922 / JCM 21250 / CCUG 30538 / CDC 9751 / IAM 14551 / NBRC 16016 / NCTC 11634 / CL345/78) TaxID=865938 RepID=F0NYJ7_WEEVC|nr:MULTISPECIES: acyl-CoA dehydrogenase family protein [Weeksella]ADX67117.1 Butyryl-CoA dehydrogenase [Weeksella virosa DSM 16922]MDK7375612.1 acyl-CoA dehydrogenase family protein [Weeksella virosa]MDK7676254.1 acyl-CoA dehydrogenase family protein [Weeksella virosa]OFM81583.1 acyl-CoA dehydrogenase [Weeksella sp. HMSC059D05]SUP53388.1 Acyl-CoA dehydrogenase, short-chain specific [Weeksella virosa]
MSTQPNRLIGGEYLVKNATYNDIFTYEDFSEEQRMIIESAKEFIDKEVVPKKHQIEKKDYALIEELMRKIGELGLLGISIPEEYGGLGMGFVTTMLVCDYISGATGSLATAFGAHTGIGTMPILLYGTEEQKQKYLPKLATGEWFSSYCLTEPEAGSDANSGKTKAVLSEDGKEYIITGQKMWITNAGFADIFIVFARIDDDKNITAFIVEKDKAGEGFSLGEEEDKLGIVSSSTRQVFFNEVRVPVENLLGERNGGFKIAMNALNVGRIKLGAACLDAQRRVLNNSLQYASERKQFNVSINTFGAIQEKLADMAVATFTSEAGAYRAAKDIQDAIEDNIAKGMPHNEAELKGIEEYAIEASILKVWISEAAQKASDEGIQIYGGMGYSKEMPMEAAWRDARISRIYEGTNEINSLLCISMLVKRAFQGRIDLMTPAMDVANELMSIPSFDIPDYTELFAQEKEIIINLKKAFFMVAGAALQKFGADLEKHQQLILAASRIMQEIYMVESAMLRAEKIAAVKGNDVAANAVKLVQLQLFKSVEIIKTEATRGIVSFAEGDEQRMMLSGLRRFTRYNEYPNVVNLKNDIAQLIIEKNEYVY